LVVLALGIVLVGAGNVLYFKRDDLVQRVTSRPLGSLAPGYAASPDGVKVYTYLVTSIGIVLVGIGISPWFARYGVLTTAVGILAFVVFSVVAIVGEVRTYRALKR